MASDHDCKETSFPLSAFDLKRRTNPSAAFAELFNGFRSALRDGGELAKAAEMFKGGKFVSREDAVRLADLEQRGISASDFTIGSLPPEIGPGLALMYDATLQVLQSSDRRVMPNRFQPRSGALLAQLATRFVPVVGSASATALEMASKDSAFAERLKGRASELTGVMELGPPGPDPLCEHCLIVIDHKDDFDPPKVYCGTKDECGAIDILFWLLILSLLLPPLLDWLF